LLRKYGFGLAKTASGYSGNENDFSAFGSHAKDHRRIIAMADDALEKLQDVCVESDAHGGTVPRSVADDLCRAFVEHATNFDSLYEGKLCDQRAMEKVIGWYNFSWKGGSFQVCFRPGGAFFCPRYRASATWTMVEDVVKIDWGQFGKYNLHFDEANRTMSGNEVPKDATNENNWRTAQFVHGLSDAENLLLGAGAGTEWEFEWKGSKFPIRFQADGDNRFVCDSFPAFAHWSIEGNQVTIHWGNFGTYRLTIDPASETMDGGELGGDQSKDTWWRKASRPRDLPVAGECRNDH